MYKSDMEIVKSLLLKESIISGNTIQIPYSVDGAKALLRIAGGMRQEVREGYNKAPLIAESEDNDGILFTVNSDGTFTAKGTVGANSRSIKLAEFDFIPYLDKTMTSSCGYVINDSNNLGAITTILLDNSNKALRYNVLNIDAGTKSDHTTGTISSEELDISNGVKMVFNLYFSSRYQGTAVDISGYLQLVEGSDNKPYEPYGASPSPEYPSKIQSCGDDINKIQYVSGSINLNNLKIVENKDKSINISGTPSQNWANLTPDFVNEEFFPGVYTFFINKALDFNIIVRLYKEQNETTSKSFIISKGTTKVSQTLDQKYSYYRIFVEGLILETNYDIRNLKLKLCKGEKATAYSPYGYGSVDVNVRNKNLTKELVYQLNCITKCKKGEVYTVSFTAENMTDFSQDNRIQVGISNKYTNLTYGEIPNILQIISVNVDNDGKFSFSIKAEYDGYLYIRTVLYTLIEHISNLQIEMSDTATEYTPHQEQNKSIYIKEPIYGNAEARDKIVRKDGKWQYEREFGKYIFTGEETDVSKHSTENNNVFMKYGILKNALLPKDNQTPGSILCSHFKNGVVDDIVYHDVIAIGLSYNNRIFICTGLNGISSVEELKAKLKELYDAGRPVYIVYKLAEPEYEKITDEEMIKSLDENQYIIEYDEETNISADNELAILEITAVQNKIEMKGAIKNE